MGLADSTTTRGLVSVENSLRGEISLRGNWFERRLVFTKRLCVRLLGLRARHQRVRFERMG